MNQRYFARFDVETRAWEVVDTLSQTVVESFSCGKADELRHYAEHRALAHATRKNHECGDPADDQQN